MDTTPPQPDHRGARSPAVDFAAAARRLGAATRRIGCVAPSFRTPPRLVGVDRTVRRHDRGAVVAVRVKGRPWAAVLADMIDGIVVVNDASPAAANRLRADLWRSVDDLAAARRDAGDVVTAGGAVDPRDAGVTRAAATAAAAAAGQVRRVA